MTYCHKLSRRLAVSGVVLPVIVAFATACGSDGSTAPELPSGSTAPRIVVSPRSVETEVGLPTQFAVYGRTSSGDSLDVGPDVEWSSTGGYMSPDGVFSAADTGTFHLVARDSTGASADTSVVTVLPSPAVIEIQPRQLSLEPGASASFTAHAAYADGLTRAARIAWTSTGGSIDSAGVFTADTIPGTYTVVVSTRRGLTDTAIVTVGHPDQPAGGAYREPAGFAAVAQRPWSMLNEGANWENPSSGDFSIVSDPSAPHSGPSVGRIRFAKGFRAGNSPAFAEYTTPAEKRFKRVYIRYWLKVSGNWYGHQVQDKIGYAWTGRKPMMFAALVGGKSNPLRVQVRLQDLWKHPAEGDELKMDLGSGAFSRGQWHLLEFVLVGNTPGVANGEAHWWVDGVKVGEARDIGWVGPGSSNTWDIFSWRPVWGGQGGTVPADQYMYMDDFYVSGAN